MSMYAILFDIPLKLLVSNIQNLQNDKFYSRQIQLVYSSLMYPYIVRNGTHVHIGYGHRAVCKAVTFLIKTTLYKKINKFQINK